VYERLVVALDGSAFSEEILPYARGIAGATRAGLTLLRVAEEEGEILEAREYVEALARELGVEGKVSLARTDVTTAILDEATRDPRALVAMTTHGRTGLLEALLGNVALSVVRNAGRPVLIYRPRGDSAGALGRDAKIDKIVLPLDGSAFSERMIPEAVEMAKSLKACLALVHVISMGVKMPAGIPAGDVLESSYIHSQAKKIEKAYGVRPDWDVLHGDPGDAICHYVEGRRDTMLAMSSHSRSGLKRTVLGSVTSECLRRSGSPLMVLWPNGTRRTISS
jgi:nucleotide-binding universal stress UspA family protein